MSSALPALAYWVESTGQALGVHARHELARGGEGVVYHLPWDSSSLAKIYLDHKAVRGEKLRTMIANPPVDPMRSSQPPWISIAWPTDLVVDVAGQVRGYIMPFIQGMKPIYAAYHPVARDKAFPRFDYRFPYFAGANLATAMQALHVKRYVVGDVNEKNILVNAKALVTAIDTDSFQVPNERGSFHRCRVFVPNYAPPEIQNQDLTKVDRGPEQDCFGLAVLLFQMLMEGNHPYDGIYTGVGESPTLAERITLGSFPHGGMHGVPVRPRPLAPNFGYLDPQLQSMFRLSFIDGHHDPRYRPTAEAWKLALRDVSNALITCHVQPRHFFSPHLDLCPWCAYEARIYSRKPKPFVAVRGMVGIQQILPPLPTAAPGKPIFVVPQVHQNAQPRAAVFPPPPAPSSVIPPPLPIAQPSTPLALSAALSQSIVTVFCGLCGQPNSVGLNFCPHCGQPPVIQAPALPAQGVGPRPADVAQLRPSEFGRAVKWITLLLVIPVAVLIGVGLMGFYLQRDLPAAESKNRPAPQVSSSDDPVPATKPPSSITAADSIAAVPATYAISLTTTDLVTVSAVVKVDKIDKPVATADLGRYAIWMFNTSHDLLWINCADAYDAHEASSPSGNSTALEQGVGAKIELIADQVNTLTLTCDVKTVTQLNRPDHQ